MTARFSLIPANSKIWNESEFIEFLIQHQGQAIAVDTNREGPDLQRVGVYTLLEQFGYTAVEIHTPNRLETHPAYKIHYTTPYFFFNTQAADYTDYHVWTQQQVFGCFYNRPLWHRIGLAAQLQYNYPDQSLINVRADPRDPDQRRLFELQELFNMDPASAQCVLAVCNTWPQQLEQADGYTVYNNTTGHTDQLAEFYPDLLIDIVGETWINGRTFFATEKTVRPMLMKKPMIVMGAAAHLDYLHQMGFRTFCDFWSEDYDGYEGRERYVRILDLVDDLASKSTQELADMYQAMQPILEHNYRLLQDKTYTRNTEYIP